MTIRFRLANMDLSTPGPWPLDEAGAHYLLRVHRLKQAALVMVFDGGGLERAAHLELEAGAPYLVPHGAVVEGLGGAPITVCYGLPKGDKLDRVARQLTELGVSRLLLINCQHSVVRLSGQKAIKRRERLMRVVAEAARQSGRSDLMEIAGPVSVRDALDQLTHHTVLVFDVDGHQTVDTIVFDKSTAVFIGPEGGFSESEFDRYAR